MKRYIIATAIVAFAIVALGAGALAPAASASTRPARIVFERDNLNNTLLVYASSLRWTS